MMKTLPLTAFVALLLCGCAGSITVHTTPEGALISSNSQTIGISPHRIMLDPDNGQSFPKAEDGCFIAPPLTAHWASGAVASSSAIPMCNGLSGNYQVFIRRPVNAPDLNKDLETENRREEVMARRREARAINNLATSEEMNANGVYIGGWGF